MTKLRTIFSLLIITFIFTFGLAPRAAAPAKTGKFFVVSTGPAGPELATLKAIETMKSADLVLCPPRTAKSFQAYLRGKKVQDPWKKLWHYQGKVWG